MTRPTTPTHLPPLAAAMASRPCAVPGCVQPGAHDPDCPGRDADGRECTGCRPRPAAPDAQVCIRHVEVTLDRLGQLPDLHDDLLTPTRTASDVGRVSGGDVEAALVLDDRARWAREAIERCLYAWTAVLIRPAEPAQAQRDAHRAAVKRGEEPAPLPAPPYGRGLTAPASLDVAHLADRVARHAPWLLAQPEHAEQFVHDVATAHRGATRDAFPVTPTGVYLGACPVNVTDPDGGPDRPCGRPVRAAATDPVVTCRGCGTTGSPQWWRTRMDTDRGDDATADVYAVAAWLSAEFARVIAPDDVRRWTTRGTRRAGRLATVGRDPRTQRVIVATAAAHAYAVTLYGPPGGPPDRTTDSATDSGHAPATTTVPTRQAPTPTPAPTSAPMPHPRPSTSPDRSANPR